MKVHKIGLRRLLNHPHWKICKSNGSKISLLYIISIYIYIYSSNYIIYLKIIIDITSLSLHICVSHPLQTTPHAFKYRTLTKYSQDNFPRKHYFYIVTMANCQITGRYNLGLPSGNRTCPGNPPCGFKWGNHRPNSENIGKQMNETRLTPHSFAIQPLIKYNIIN